MGIKEHALKLIKKDYPEDIKIDLHYVSQLPFMIEKYLSTQFDLMTIISRLDFEYNKKTGERFKYYREDYNFTLSSSEIKNYMLSDSELVKIKEQLVEIELLLKQITEIITEIRNLHWISKTSLEYTKYSNHGQ